MKSLEERRKDRAARMHMTQVEVKISQAAIATLQTEATAEVASKNAEAEAQAQADANKTAARVAGQRAAAVVKGAGAAKPNPFDAKKK